MKNTVKKNKEYQCIPLFKERQETGKNKQKKTLTWAEKENYFFGQKKGFNKSVDLHVSYLTTCKISHLFILGLLTNNLFLIY